MKNINLDLMYGVPGQSRDAVAESLRKLVALGRLSAGVAHEVKNPLNAMTIHLELLEQKLRQAAEVESDGPDLAPALEHVRVIGGEVQRLDQVMQGFIKFNRPEDLKLQAIAVSSLVDGVVRVIGPECASAGVRVVTAGLEGLPEISGDPDMLRQALLNLALNAVQAMPEGGTLRISAAAARGRRVEILVEDTGVGIKPEHLGRIFDLYFTTRAKGSGIGLSMVYRTVQLHDGEIEVQSTEGRGTTFRIVLPQAVRLVIPPVTNDFIALFKDSSLVSVITMVELTKEYGLLALTTYDFMGLGLMTAAIYFLLSYPVSLLARHLERKLHYDRR